MRLSGELQVAGDKSITHRAIILSSLATGQTVIHDPLLGADCLSTLEIFKQFGVTYQLTANQLIIDSPGVDGFTYSNSILDAGNSGTTARLLMGVLSALPTTLTLVGDASLSKRPMKRVTSPLKQMGACIELTHDQTLPATIKGQSLNGIEYELPVASAQVKSAIMLAAMFASGETKIHEPVPTRDHTEKMFEDFQIVYNKENRVITLSGPQMPKTPGQVFVPADISSAAFFMVAALMVEGSDLILKNVGLNETRCGIVDVLLQMGGRLTIQNERYFGGERVADIRVQYTKDLKGIIIEGEMIPRLIDEIPIIALLATKAMGQTIIKDAEELKVKETNRIDVTVGELKAIGANLFSTEDGMVINGDINLSYHPALVSSHGDHRIAMMLYVASLLMKNELEIEEMQAMNISYPDFLVHMQKVLK
ncbi:MAG: 3-phosphoshikimate 1-carboxyvinyltransferase [Turicibacter sanguinis]|jgi:3-phosphoshikimate 1-carboxyvinyltransferase|uniref:3-phosphoshikimate 1-carboxyvinyltransferase n=1 Tax=Turicibacter TaxID=191303 RepID=UPI0001FD8486|nr:MULTISPECIES: 3-phosphoshikimate 1-carboxyvinyltransferase [Turicibacter]EGC91177.1 3-phosphoshikimate 1-carboxyvinyltransferase [Turicibacter sp. HGF1]MBP3903837.1 3-phosphoshikimate 1-carboxyvinyltransferase [Turicibacter sp.]MCU7197062.1 3-phosphoshikimate 1-carboxyvinyltransferase [Turicibacter sanguinis]MCU7202664.1 3-phosphoshikimate 1-carboxyvinyltransferase [Turicibacter sanguinis]MCU7211136.1 3-phosphoshikimate 1-carboxyvinyltransferase [Turicibacter sanguinis]